MTEKVPIVHAISARGIVFNKHNKLLLVGSNLTDWHIPGGILTGIESSAEACEREVYEETGLKVKVSSFAGISEMVYDARLLHGNFLKITNIHYHCTLEDDENLPPNWSDPDGELIKYRKFFTEEEHNKTQVRHMFEKMPYEEIKKLSGKHFGYYNKTLLTVDEIFAVAYDSKTIL